MIVFVLLDGVAYVHRFMGVDMLEIRCHVEGYGGYHAARAVVLKLKLDVLQILADQFGRAEVKYVARAEEGFLVARAEWIEFPEPRHKLGRDVGKRYVGVYVNLRT